MLNNRKIKTFNQFSIKEFDRLFNKVAERTGRMCYLSKPAASLLAKQSEHRFVQAVDEDGRVGFFDYYSLNEVKMMDNVFLVISTFINWEDSSDSRDRAVICFEIKQFDDDMVMTTQLLYQAWFKAPTKSVPNAVNDIIIMINTLINREEYNVEA